MKRTRFLISVILFVIIFLSSNSFSQNYVHYATLTGHTDRIFSIAFSPDGQTLVSGGADTTIRLWDVFIGKHKKTLTEHTDWVRSISFSPDGRTLISGGSDTIRLWDIAAQKWISLGNTLLRREFTFSPDGKVIACSNPDNTIRLYDATTLIYKKTLIGHTRNIFSLSFSPDGKTLASSSWNEQIRLWDIGTGKHKKTIDGAMEFAFSPDGQTLVGKGGTSKHRRAMIRLWNVNTGKHKKTLTEHVGDITTFAFSPDGKTLASTGLHTTDKGYKIRLWDVDTGKHEKTLTGHTRFIASILFTSDGLTLVSGSWDKTIRLWDVATGRHKKTLEPEISVDFVSMSPDGKTLACSSVKTIHLWRATDTDTIDLSKYLNLRKPPKPTANQIYTNAIRAVMWIVNPGIGEGSGVLIDKKSKLAVTNAHVTGSQNTIDVYFPAPDEKGELIKDRNFYLTSGNVLKRLGYYTKGHVVAKNEKTDLAIIRLNGLPETAREIDSNFTAPATKAGELVYILGNPAKQELWRWTLGEFLNDHQDFLHIQSDVFGGNSDGPVLNKQGILLGIVARSDQLMNAVAIPIRHINRLLSESKVKHSRFRR